MTKQALENIAGEVQAVLQKLDTSTRKIDSLVGMNAHKDDVISILKDTVKCVGDLVNLILADAYTYKIITKAESSQIPVASREQHTKGILDVPAESESLAASSITRVSGMKSSSPVVGKKPTLTANLMFITKSKTTPVSKKTEDKLPLSSRKSSQDSVAKASGPSKFDVPLISSSPVRDLFKTVASKKNQTSY
jgi:hypothetical protein